MVLFSITKIRMNDIASMSLYLCHSHHPRWPSAAVAVASTSWTQSEADRQQLTEQARHSQLHQKEDQGDSMSREKYESIPLSHRAQ
jgi:hypothetical protein